MGHNRRVYYIPRYKEKTGGQADSWVKLYRKDVLLSQAYKQLTLSEKGVWFHLFLLANKDGELRSGHLIYTDKHLAKELKTPIRTWNRIRSRLLSSSIGLLATKSIQLSGKNTNCAKKSSSVFLSSAKAKQLSNNCPTIVKPNGVKSSPAGKIQEGGEESPKLQNRIDKIRIEKKRKEEKDMSSQKEETTPVSKSIPSCPYKKIAEVWNKMAQEHKLPTVKSIEGRKGAMNTRWRDEFWRENWEAAIDLIPKQAWMLGDNKNNWKANIDYFLRSKTVATIIEAAEVMETAKSAQKPEKPFYEEGTKVRALTNRYRGIKVGSKGTVGGCFVSFPGSSGTHQGIAIHQEQIRENPYDWKVLQFQ